MQNVILHRPFETDNLQNELSAISASGFQISNDVNLIPSNSRVFPRFYPFYQYLEDDIRASGSHLVTNAQQLDFVSDIRAWYPVLTGLTPITWQSVAEVIDSGYIGPFFCKGVDKSLKYDFQNLCYAENIDSLKKLVDTLKETILGYKPIVIRAFEELVNYGFASDMGNAPIAHEFRTFVYGGQIVSQSFYWEAVKPSNTISNFGAEPPVSLLQEVIDRIGDKAAYYSIDTALAKNGNWTVIEINDGCLSGLCGIDPLTHYKKLNSLAK